MSTETFEKPVVNPDAPQYQNAPAQGYYPQQTGYMPYWNYYQPARTNPNRVLNAVFWIFYILVGFWVDLSLTITLWTLAVVLPFSLPMAALLWNSTDHTLWQWDDGYRFYQITEAQMYTGAGIMTVIGILLLAFAIFTFKPWLRFHRAMFRDLGGVNF